MKNRRNLLFTIVLIIALAGTACEGPTGSTGPEGSRGPQGEQGPQGEDGDANIMYSDWMDIEWSEDSSDSQKDMGFRESRITADFFNDGGIVLMFMKEELGSGFVRFYTLPLITESGNFLYRFNTFTVEGDEGGIVFYILSLDGSAIPDSLWEDFQIRYILIPGSMNLTAKGVDLENYKYETVAEYYGIPHSPNHTPPQKSSIKNQKK